MKPRVHLRLQQPLRIGTLRRGSLYGLLALLTISGAVWLWLHQGRADDALPSPMEPWLMKLHGGAAMLIIYLTGTMLQGHMLNAWHRARNRTSGGIAAAVFLLLAVSGYGLYYFSGDAIRAATEWLHWIVGFAAPLLLWWHIRRGRRGRI